MVFCAPFYSAPAPGTLHPFMTSLEAAIPAIVAAGWEEGLAQEVNCPYISGARAAMLRKALDAKADVIVFHDYDISAPPEAYVKLLEAEGDVVAGDYRYKLADEKYMSGLAGEERPTVRADGCIKALRVPAGFLKVTKKAVDRFARAYPHLLYGDPMAPSVDLFNHGAHDFVWWGEDMAFSRNWVDCGGEIWIVPDLDITHWDGKTPYPGNLHRFLLRQPGGSEDPAMRIAAE